MSAFSTRVPKQFTSSIPLWMRGDRPREAGMNYWKGPHSKIISASPGLKEYRQIHLAEANEGSWPATSGVETSIPPDRRIDGIAEVTFQSLLSPVLGRGQTQLAFKDEVNVFRRTLLYLAPPTWSRWYEVADPGQTVGARVLIQLRRRDGVRPGDFRRFVSAQLVPALIAYGGLRELRTQNFLPWSRRLWDTPSVAHDNPPDQQFHASVIVGFKGADEREAFLRSREIDGLSAALAPFASAVHAYEVAETLAFVRDGAVLPHYQE